MLRSHLCKIKPVLAYAGALRGLWRAEGRGLPLAREEEIVSVTNRRTKKKKKKKIQAIRRKRDLDFCAAVDLQQIFLFCFSFLHSSSKDFCSMMS